MVYITTESETVDILRAVCDQVNKCCRLLEETGAFVPSKVQPSLREAQRLVRLANLHLRQNQVASENQDSTRSRSEHEENSRFGNNAT